MLIRQFILLTILLCLTQLAFAKNGFSSITGETLKKACTAALQALENKSDPQDISELGSATGDTAACLAYISAVNDTIFFMSGVASGIIENPNAKIEMPYCFPDNIESTDYIKNILKYINENPKSLSVHGSIVIFGAFKKYYPCH